MPNSGGAPWADTTGSAAEGWEADGAMVRSAYTLHEEHDDFGQPGTLVREVLNDSLAVLARMTVLALVRAVPWDSGKLSRHTAQHVR